MNLHLIAPFHTRLTQRWSSCAFSMKALRFSKMMHFAEGYHITEYSNYGSESEADEKVVMLEEGEFEQHFPPQKEKEFHGSYATMGNSGWTLFNDRLVAALRERLKPGDIVCHPFGQSHQSLPSLFPNNEHVETGIGYPDKPFGCWRIFESNAWRHYHWGRDEDVKDPKGMNRFYSWVIPNYFDVADWPLGDGTGDYVVYMGRICPEKGMATLVEVIKAMPDTRFVFAGQGDFDGLIGKHPNAEYVGVVYGKDRATLVGNARCMVMPTNFIEPFGGSGVEALLCGTPLVAVDYGAFTETVERKFNGYRCHTLGDWVKAIECLRGLKADRRGAIQHSAQIRYSLQTCSKLYNAAFQQIADLKDKGWFTRKARNV